MRDEGDESQCVGVQRMRSWISSEQQPGQLSWDWGGGEVFVEKGVRPEDSDYILRPVRGDWDQDCKPKYYLCCSGT